MKTSTSTYNPLQALINSFPLTASVGLSYAQINTVKNLLDLGGVHCESDDEVVDCLELLHELGALTVEKVRNKNKIYFKVTKNYNV